jgi:hypothetical protein
VLAFDRPVTPGLDGPVDLLVAIGSLVLRPRRAQQPGNRRW